MTPAEHVRRMTLNRPEQRNALNNAMHGVQEHEHDQQLRVSRARRWQVFLLRLRSILGFERRADLFQR